jgi:putative sugar O-methyltransferase
MIIGYVNKMKNNIDNDGVSELWKDLTRDLYSDISEQFLDGFRKPESAANRFSTWPPKEATFRYYLTLLFNQIRKKDVSFFDKYKKIGNTNIGQPLCVHAHGLGINLDYLTSIEEYDFLSSSMKLSNVKSVIEIGAGFGRTAHTCLKLLPNIERYTIVDLEPMLVLSKGYLTKALSTEELKKISFISSNDASLAHEKYNLAINIDSFQEMPKQTIENYMKNLFSKSDYVYIKNPVCKYAPELLGIENAVLQDVFSLGLMTEVANIFDEDELGQARRLYVERYCPSKLFNLIEAMPSELFSYYHHALYMKL